MINHRWVLILILLLGSNLASAQSWSVVEFGKPRVSPMPAEMFLTGNWPDNCIPKLVAIESTEYQLTVRTQSSTEACRPGMHYFEIPLKLDHSEASSAEFNWLHRNSEAAAYNQLGFRLLNLSGQQTDSRPGSGWWWPEPGGEFSSGGPGTGLTVDFQQGYLTLLTQSFDQQGSPDWQLATGQMDGNQFNAPLIRFVAGQTLTGDYQPPELELSRHELSIQFNNAATATVWFSRRLGDNLSDPIELRKLSLVRYVMNPPVGERFLLGEWLLIVDPGRRASNTYQSVVIDRIQAAGDGQIRLVGIGGERLGQCRMNQQRSESPPLSCTLDGLPDNEVIEINNFDLDELHGLNQELRMVRLIRLANRP